MAKQLWPAAAGTVLGVDKIASVYEAVTECLGGNDALTCVGNAICVGGLALDPETIGTACLGTKVLAALLNCNADSIGAFVNFLQNPPVPPSQYPTNYCSQSKLSLFNPANNCDPTVFKNACNNCCTWLGGTQTGFNQNGCESGCGNLSQIVPSSCAVCKGDAGAGGGGTGGCFAAGTPITMADGTTKPIEAIHTGDTVLSYDPVVKVTATGRVERTFVHANSAPLIRVNDKLLATANHPFYAHGEWIPAGELSMDDTVLELDVARSHAPSVGWAPQAAGVSSLQTVPPVDTVYNIQVATYHDYFAAGVLVHNKDTSPGSSSGAY
jgi:hypothetical protein